MEEARRSVSSRSERPEFKSERGIGAERLQLESILKRDTLRRRLEG